MAASNGMRSMFVVRPVAAVHSGPRFTFSRYPDQQRMQPGVVKRPRAPNVI